MLQTVPTTSILSMAATLVMTVVYLIVVFAFLKKKTGGEFLPVLMGAGTFFVFSMVLESLLHLLVMTVFGRDITENMWFYAIYGGLAAGIFEETGRWISMTFLMKKRLSKENALMYGVGHGGIEILLTTGLTYVSNMVTAVMINSGMMEDTLKQLEEPLRQQTIEQLSALWTTPSYLFLLAAVERMAALALQIGLSYLVYRAVKYHKPFWFIAAVLLHFLTDAGLVLLAKTIPLYAVEGVLVGFVICLSVGIYRLYRSEKEPEPACLTEEDG